MYSAKNLSAYAKQAVDIEKQAEADSGTRQLDHTVFLEQLFLLDAAGSSRVLHQWPGISAYCEHVESCFSGLADSRFDCVWSANQPQSCSTNPAWQWMNKVVGIMRDRRAHNYSIKDICVKLGVADQEAAGDDLILEQQLERDSATTLSVFAALCWTTMFFQPNLTDPFSSVVRSRRAPLPLKDDLATRTIEVLFRKLQRTIGLVQWQQVPPQYMPVGTGRTTILHLTSLHFASLNTIAKIQLTWVDDLSRHLEFDAGSRQLSIFRFPSYSALVATRAEGMPPLLLNALDSLLMEINANANQDFLHNDNLNFDHIAVQCHQEVLVSYRLLFGQNRRSRQFVAQSLRTLKNQCPLGTYDVLLDTLCTGTNRYVRNNLPPSLWPRSCRDLGNRLQGQASYSSHDDFPIFGERLANLQDFNLRQQPSQLRDLWRDRRNPLQWYTFWAVLVIGGLSIVLAVLQLAVSIAQLRFTIPQPV